MRRSWSFLLIHWRKKSRSKWRKRMGKKTNRKEWTLINQVNVFKVFYFDSFNTLIWSSDQYYIAFIRIQWSCQRVLHFFIYCCVVCGDGCVVSVIISVSVDDEYLLWWFVNSEVEFVMNGIIFLTFSRAITFFDVCVYSFYLYHLRSFHYGTAGRYYPAVICLICCFNHLLSVSGFLLSPFLWFLCLDS